MLNARDAVNIFGSVTLDASKVGRLVLGTPAIYGYGASGDVARIWAGEFIWTGSEAAPGAAMANILGDGKLDIAAQRLVFGYAPNSRPSSTVTDNRLALYRTLPNVKSVTFAAKIKYGGYNFFLTHFPCLTGNIEKESLKQMSLNLSGHTHSKDKFFYDLPYVYNVAMDAHNCTPVSVDELITDMIAKVEECKKEL